MAVAPPVPGGGKSGPDAWKCWFLGGPFSGKVQIVKDPPPTFSVFRKAPRFALEEPFPTWAPAKPTVYRRIGMNKKTREACYETEELG